MGERWEAQQYSPDRVLRKQAAPKLVATLKSSCDVMCMATQADVRRIAMALPNVEEAKDRFAFSVLNKGKPKGFAWVWLERISPKAARVPNPKVLAVRVANVGEKNLLISHDPKKFFTEPHYNGFPAVLVRLDAVTVADLKVLLREAWRCQAPAEPKARAVAKSTRPVRRRA